MGVRRVVTGHSTDGKAVVASDEVVDPITLDLLPGYEFYRLWGSNEPRRRGPATWPTSNSPSTQSLLDM